MNSVKQSGYFVLDNSMVRYSKVLSEYQVRYWNFRKIGPLHCQKCLDHASIFGYVVALCYDCADNLFQNDKCNCYNENNMSTNGCNEGTGSASSRIYFGFGRCAHRNCPISSYEKYGGFIQNDGDADVSYTLHSPGVVSIHIKYIEKN